MNSPTKDLLQFAKIRGLPIVLYQPNKRGPITVELKQAATHLTQSRYDWSITPDRLNLYAEGYEGAHSPAGKRLRKAAQQAAAGVAPAGDLPAREAGQEGAE